MQLLATWCPAKNRNTCQSMLCWAMQCLITLWLTPRQPLRTSHPQPVPCSFIPPCVVPRSTELTQAHSGTYVGIGPCHHGGGSATGLLGHWMCSLCSAMTNTLMLVKFSSFSVVQANQKFGHSCSTVFPINLLTVHTKPPAMLTGGLNIFAYQVLKASLTNSCK